MDSVQRQPDVRAGARRLEHQQIADHSQDVASSLPGGNQRLHAVGEEEQATLSLLVVAAKDMTAANSPANSPLEAVPGAEIPGAAHVHHEHDRQFRSSM